MNNFFTKILMLEISTRLGFIGSIKRYQVMGQEIKKIYGELNYENYCKYINSYEGQNNT